MKNAEEQETLFDLDLWCGKMCRELSAQERPKAGISAEYSKKLYESPSRQPLICLSLVGDGVKREYSWEVDGALLGELMTRNIGEYPNEEKESALSQILEENPHPKYYLSARGCQGILRRTERKGRELPDTLKKPYRNSQSYR